MMQARDVAYDEYLSDSIGLKENRAYGYRSRQKTISSTTTPPLPT